MPRKQIMVFAAAFWSGATGRSLADGFSSLGWNVQEIECRYQVYSSRRSIPLRIASRLLTPVTKSSYIDHILEYCLYLRPDIFFTVKGLDISPDLLRQIKETGARTIMYYPDLHFSFRDMSIESFDEYDLFVTTKTFQLPYLRKLLGDNRVAYVPHGYCDVHQPVFDLVDESEFKVDLLYSGNHSAYKQKWLENALVTLPKPSVAILGNGWREKASKGLLSRCEMPGGRTGVAYAQAIQSARINIALHMGPTASGWEDLVSTRTFEIPACKGFMLHIDNEEVREFFTPGEEIDVFSSPEELADKIRFYLDRPELRAQMIERAYSRSVPDYSYAKRAKQVATLFKGIR